MRIKFLLSVFLLIMRIHLNMLFQPAHEIWIHIACALSFSINMHVQLSSVDKGHDF